MIVHAGRGTARRVALMIACGALVAMPVVAQKAEPNRIDFRGSSSAVVEGSLSGREQMEYALAARREQSLSLQLTAAPAGSLVVKLRGPADRELPLKPNGRGRWTAALVDDGDYQIWVVRTRDGPSVSTYRLRVSVR